MCNSEYATREIDMLLLLTATLAAIYRRNLPVKLFPPAESLEGKNPSKRHGLISQAEGRKARVKLLYLRVKRRSKMFSFPRNQEQKITPKGHVKIDRTETCIQ